MGKRNFVPGINRTSSTIGPRIFGGKRAYFSLINSASGPMPALNLNFSGGLSVPSSVTFSRASSGTYFDSNGVLQSASTNTARFSYLYNGSSWVSRGLLIEAQRTNQITYSEDVSQSNWSTLNLTKTANSLAALDGTTTAGLFEENTVNNFHQVSLDGVTFNGPVTLSVFVKWKPGTTRNIGIIPVNSSAAGSNAGVIFNSSGAYVGDINSPVTRYEATSLGNGWFRFSATVSSNGLATTGPTVRFMNGTTGSYLGDGTSGLYIWGAQYGTGADEVTSYIKTTGSAATRSADVATISGSNFSSFFNASEGTIVVEGTSPGVSTRTLVAFDDNTANESIIIRTSGTDPIFAVTDGGSTQCSLDGGTITAGTQFKFAATYKANDFAACLNGGTVQTDTGGTIPTVDRMRIGADQAGNYLNGFVGRIRYYNTRLSNSQLQALTS